MINEASAKIYGKIPEKISKEMDVFYNPVMKFNRDMAVLVLNCIPCKKIGLPLEASGIRGIRILAEVKCKKEVFLNDISPDAVKMMKKNFKLNNIKGGFKIFNQDANIFLLENKGFDYIDIDPFGSPNPFLDSALKAIAREGIIAVTATDTAPLA
jgi:tRNA (guanine26-N2/guanine27-N2)-dimethyltransferase